MRRSLHVITLLAALFALPLTASAHGKEKHHNRPEKYGDAWRKHATAVPELDPSGVGAAAALLSGGLLALMGRRRR